MNKKNFFTIIGVSVGVLLFQNSYAKNFVPVPTVKGIPSVTSPFLCLQHGVLSNAVNNRMNAALGVFNKSTLSPLAKTTATASRLTDLVETNGVDTVFDSTHYTYSGTNGGQPLDKFLFFDNAIFYQYNSGYNPYQKYTQTITSGEVMNQTIQSYTYGTWVNSAKYTNTYDGLGNLTLVTTQSWNGNAWTNTDQIKYVYTASTLIEADEKTWNNGSWVNANRWVYTFNSDNSIASIEQYIWNTASSTWDNYYLDSYTYDDGDMLTDILQVWNNGSWVNYDEYVNAYLNHNLISEYYNVWDANNSWDNNTYSTFDYTSNLIKTQTTQVWNTNTGGYENSSRIDIAYNTFSQYTTYAIFSWNGNAWVNASQKSEISAFYQPYSKETSVPTTTATASEINVYPVPSDNSLSINYTGSENANFTLRVMDLQGKVVKEWNGTGINYHTTIATNELASGVYFLNIVNSGSILTHKFIISH